MEVITTGKIFHCKCCLINPYIRVKKNLTQSFFKTNVDTNFQLLSITFIDYCLNVNKQYLTYKSIMGKFCGVYVTYCMWLLLTKDNEM